MSFSACKKVVNNMRLLTLALMALLLLPISTACSEQDQQEQAPASSVESMPPEPDIIGSIQFQHGDIVIQTQSGETLPFSIELALTPQQQMMGMMHRTEMADDSGMLFLFNQISVRSFWMKNTLIPLDMLFIDQAGIIQHIHHEAVPRDLTGISSQVPVRGVLELKGGMSKKLGIQKGDQVVHPAFALQN